MKQTALTLILLLCLATTVWAEGDNAQKRKQKKRLIRQMRSFCAKKMDRNEDS